MVLLLLEELVQLRIVPSNILRRYGGGIFVLESGATIKNNIIESNDYPVCSRFVRWGNSCVVSINAPHYVIANNIIRNNSITTAVVQFWSLGGGIYTFTQGSCRIANNIIMDNTITAPVAYGGGILPAGIDNENYLVENNLIAGNILNAPFGGSGGIDIFNHSFPVRNNLIINNSAPRGGGIGIEFTTSEANLNSGRGYDTEMLAKGDNHQSSFQGVQFLVNNTIVNNSATIEGGGVAVTGTEIPLLMNNIIWGNTASVRSTNFWNCRCSIF